MPGTKTDFIIKLRIIDSDGLSHIHRVRPSYIQEEDGSISFQNLADVATQLRFPDTLLMSDECHVTFIYYNIHNDRVTISSTNKLIDAINQFQKSKRILRLTADIRRKTNDEQLFPMKQINKNHSGTVNKIIRENNEKPNSFFGAFASLFINDEQNKKSTKTKERPFLHCRHTCDKCRCTPIVGPRYHAAPDVDLCTKCFQEYKGDEFDFVLEEQERDRPYQDLWYEKWERMNSSKNNGLLSWWNQGTENKSSEKELREKLNKVMTQYETESQMLDDYLSLERKSATAA